MFPNYNYVPLTTREPDAGGKKTYIQDLLADGRLEQHLGRRLDPSATHVYLCGNPGMIGVPVKDRATGERRYPRPVGVVELLETRFGFTADDPAAKLRGNIHFEEYW
jgi:ferredoxin--NADP+ reductase